MYFEACDSNPAYHSSAKQCFVKPIVSSAIKAIGGRWLSKASSRFSYRRLIPGTDGSHNSFASIQESGMTACYSSLVSELRPYIECSTAIHQLDGPLLTLEMVIQCTERIHPKG
ncbi:hypothetical protein BAUCODRAFT_294059 [Baudoinia panamericana UAMH 10762]|uniref:Uncharacterized protein n=1 Tax=Baudoinia panamericana (strain UAMH 10762) TaxID=717646 RepID=M2M848_BAUPA|nr:uncharacterized protein BAUCODRAFT_294059 [Baudoinia panamericana UAMH 10762]EMC92511.1 hypothetical protein BAUCODRAFT_294059 [Baudoinia panamericana UAMH 10762]